MDKMITAIAVISTDDEGVGGIRRHALEMVNAWSMETTVIYAAYRDRVLQLGVCRNGRWIYKVESLQDGSFDILREVFDAYHVGLVHIHSFFWITKELHGFYKAMGVPYVYTIHGYHAVCPMQTLTTGYDRHYCGYPDDLDECRKCLKKSHREAWRYSRDQIIDIEQYLRMYLGLLNDAAMLVAVSDDVKRRILQRFPGLKDKIQVIENPEVVEPDHKLMHEALSKRCKRERDTKSVRIGCIGAISYTKGRDIIEACARAAETRYPDMEFIVFGTLSPTVKQPPQNLTIRGRYREEDVYGQIADEDIDFFWFPAIWPETYSYTLSIPVRLGIPIVSSNLGAPKDRIERQGWGATYKWDSSPEEILDFLHGFDYRHYEATGDFVIHNDHFPTIEEYYGDIWQPHTVQYDEEKAKCIFAAFKKNQDGHGMKDFTLFEWKWLMRRTYGFFARLSLIRRFSIHKLWIDLKHKGIRGTYVYIRSMYS